MNKQLKDLLSSNPIQNIAALGFFNNYPVENFEIFGNSAIIFGKSDQLWAHLVGSSKTEIRELLNRHPLKTNYFYSIEEWIVPLILEFGKMDWEMKTRRYILDKNVVLPMINFNVDHLTVSDSSFIYFNSDYKKFTSIDYIEDRLAKDISSCVYQKNKLVAWGFTHDDGALGFLHVLPEFRKQGFGEQVLLSLIHKRRGKNQPVFCNIVLDNDVSVNLVTKYKFQFDRVVSWIKLINKF